LTLQCLDGVEALGQTSHSLLCEHEQYLHLHVVAVRAWGRVVCSRAWRYVEQGRFSYRPLNGDVEQRILQLPEVMLSLPGARCEGIDLCGVSEGVRRVGEVSVSEPCSGPKTGGKTWNQTPKAAP
jgi:hypothetical protein